MANAAVVKLAERLGLRSIGAGGIHYGILDGYPAHVEQISQGNYVHLRAVLRFEAGKEAEVRQAVGSGALAEVATNPALLHVEGGVAALLIKSRIFRGPPKLEQQVAMVRALVAALQQASAAPLSHCAQCGATEKGDPVLLRGRVDRVCQSCLSTLEDKVRANRAAYQARRVNIVGALFGALIAAAVGALAYGAVIAVTGRLFWLVPIVAGALIAWAAVQGAGRTSAAVQVIAVAATLLSTMAGLVGYVGWQVQSQAAAQGTEVDWIRFLAATPSILIESGSDAAFSFVGGLVGAIGAAQRLKTPDFQEVGR